LGSAGSDGGANVGGSAGTAPNTSETKCKPVNVPPKTNLTPEEQARAALIHEFCVNLAEEKCLDAFADPIASLAFIQSSR
jgi:hypothetical protein